MVKQINLDRWQTDHLADLLHRGSMAAEHEGRPIEIYRRVLEEGCDCYEEVVCTLIQGYVIEQMVTSGGPFHPALHTNSIRHRRVSHNPAKKEQGAIQKDYRHA